MAGPVDDDAILRPHTGSFDYHDDDCLCVMGGAYCNRDGYVWSCCGSCKEHSDCSRPETHPTYWNHPLSSATHSGEWVNHRPLYKSNTEIRALMPEAFSD